MQILRDQKELIRSISEHTGTALTDIEAAMIVEYLKSEDESLAYDENKGCYCLMGSSGTAEELSGLQQAVIKCLRRAEAVTEAMIQQINIYNNCEDAEFSRVIGQDVEILAALSERLKEKKNTGD